MEKMNLRQWLRKLKHQQYASSADMLKYLRDRGAEIGEDVLIYSTRSTVIDGTCPWLLKIGNHVRITEGVKVLTHDYSWSVLKRYQSENICPGSILGAQSPVTIGDHVFIGMNAVVTRGVTIGDNVIIGAGSVVTKDCESNSVYAGNPAKRIMSIEEYYYKRKNCQFDEAKAMAIRYQERFGTKPPKEVFSEYFMLFSTKDEAVQNKVFQRQMKILMNYEECKLYMTKHKPMFSSYEEFLNACYEKQIGDENYKDEKRMK